MPLGIEDKNREGLEIHSSLGLPGGWPNTLTFATDFGGAELFEEGGTKLLRHEAVERKVNAATKKGKQVHEVTQRIVHCFRKTVATETANQQQYRLQGKICY